MEEKLKEIFTTIFGLEDSEINDDFRAEIIESWDSTTHLIIITEIEALFNIEILEEQIAELTSYKKIKDELKIRGVIQ
jgi:acyl carrier protein